MPVDLARRRIKHDAVFFAGGVNRDQAVAYVFTNGVWIALKRIANPAAARYQATDRTPSLGREHGIARNGFWLAVRRDNLEVAQLAVGMIGLWSLHAG